MPKISITEEVEIEVPVGRVYEYLGDFKNWSEWSPWLICEDDCEVKYSDDSEDWYSWDGKYVGAGKMKLRGKVENEKFDYLLKFYKPWKSEANVNFNLSESEEGTELLWTMESSLPWYLWWMKSMMKRLVEMDYKRGLRMMKEALENGSVDSKMEYTERESFPGASYLGVKGECMMEDFEIFMDMDFRKLKDALKEKGIKATEFFSIYDEWNLNDGKVAYKVCAGVYNDVDEVPDGLIKGWRKACDAFVIKHVGGYHHLGNAWSAGMLRARSKPPVFKQSRRKMPFEIYKTEPGSGEDVVTKVVLPIRG